MPSVITPRKQIEMQLFGCSVADIKKEVARATTPETIAVNLITSAEQKVHEECAEEASQMINRAMYILSEFCSPKKGKSK